MDGWIGGWMNFMVDSWSMHASHVFSRQEWNELEVGGDGSTCVVLLVPSQAGTCRRRTVADH